MDIHFVHEAMQEPLIAAFLDIRSSARRSSRPSRPWRDTDLDAYFALIIDRFANPAIGDTVRRLCLDGSNRQPKFIVPTIADRLGRGKSVDGLAWNRRSGVATARAHERFRKADRTERPNWERLVPIAQASRQDPGRWLAMDDIYTAMSDGPQPFAASFARALEQLWSQGTRRTLETYSERRPEGSTDDASGRSGHLRL